MILSGAGVRVVDGLSVRARPLAPPARGALDEALPEQIGLRQAAELGDLR
jgi:hypothetical protein